jgi:hypothetical protein
MRPQEEGERDGWERIWVLPAAVIAASMAVLEKRPTKEGEGSELLRINASSQEVVPLLCPCLTTSSRPAQSPPINQSHLLAPAPRSSALTTTTCRDWHRAFGDDFMWGPWCRALAWLAERASGRKPQRQEAVQAKHLLLDGGWP